MRCGALPHVVRAFVSRARPGAGGLRRSRRLARRWPGLPAAPHHHTADRGQSRAGALLTFSFSMLEVSDSLILAQKHDFFPVTKVLFELVNILGPGPSIACAFAVWAMLFLASIARLGGGGARQECLTNLSRIRVIHRRFRSEAGREMTSGQRVSLVKASIRSMPMAKRPPWLLDCRSTTTPPVRKPSKRPNMTTDREFDMLIDR